MQVVISLSSFASANGSGLMSRFTMAMVPLLTAQGPGAVSRFSIGLTIYEHYRVVFQLSLAE